MPTLEFEVLGPPRPKERARITKNGDYTPTKTKEYQNAVANAAFVAIHTQLKEDGPWYMETTYELECWFHIAPLTGKARLPDGDNMLKAVQDGLEGCLFKNDKLIRRGIYNTLTDCPVAKTVIRIRAL